MNVLISTLEARRAEVDKAIRGLSAELVSSKGCQLYQDNLGADLLTAEADRLHRGLIKLEGINTNVFENPGETALGAVVEKQIPELSDLQRQLATETFIQDTGTYESRALEVRLVWLGLAHVRGTRILI